MKLIQILINAKDNASSVFDKLQTKVAAVGAAIVGYFGIQAFAGVVKGAADFEAAMSRVQAATGASAEEMVKLNKLARDAAASSGFSNVETADALTNLAKAGADANQAMAALPGVIALAQAGEVGLAESSEYLTKIIASMGGEFADAGKYADVLAMGANASNTSVTGLAQALSYAAPSAKALNLSLETTVGLIGKFADSGIDASRAGTALNSILSQFLDPASKFRTELSLMGITTTNFEDALKQLAEAGPRGANAILAVGMEAGPAFRGLLNAGIPALQQLIDKLKNAEGSAAATAKTLRDNLNGSLSSLGNAWKAVTDVLGTPVLPVLKQGVDELTAAFRRAVEDGTVLRFGESIATAMRNGMQFVREFMSTVNFDQVMVRLQKFADDTNATLTKVGEYATTAGNTIKIAYGSIQTSGNILLAAMYSTAAGITTVIQGLLQGLELLYRASAKITFGDLSKQYKEIADELEMRSNAMGAAVQALGDKLRGSLGGVVEGVDTVREGFEGMAKGLSDSADQGERTGKVMASVAAELSRGAEAAANYGIAMQKKANAEVLSAQATKEARQHIAGLREEYHKLVADGNLTEAGKKLEEINQALRRLGPAAKEGSKALADINQAWTDLNLVSTSRLKELAEQGKRAFDTLKASGTESAERLGEAFRVAAERAIEANRGIAPAWVIAEAGVRGYKIAVDEAGRSTLEAANKGAEGLGRLARGWYETREAIQAHEDAMDRILMKHKLSADYTERQIALLEREAAAAEKAAEAYRKKWNMDKEGYSLNTAGERINQGETQEQIDEDVKRRYGEENVNNPDAQRARQLAVLLSMMSQLGGQVRDPATSKQIADMRRELQELEAALLNGIGAKPKDPAGAGGASGGRGGSSSNDNDNEDDSRGRRPGRGGGVSAGSGAGGIAPVINIHLAPGVDLSNRAEAERMARQLIPAIETLSRRGFHA